MRDDSAGSKTVLAVRWCALYVVAVLVKSFDWHQTEPKVLATSAATHAVVKRTPNAKLFLAGLAGGVGCFLLLFAHPACGEDEISDDVVTVTVDNDHPKLAEPFEFTVSVNVLDSQVVSFAPVGDQLGLFDVLATSRSITPDESEADSRVWSQTFRLESFELGEQIIPTIEIVIDSADESESSDNLPIVVRSPEQSVTVEGVIPAEELEQTDKVRPIADAKVNASGGEVDRMRWWSWSLVPFGLLAVAAIAWRIKRNRNADPYEATRLRLLDVRRDADANLLRDALREHFALCGEDSALAMTTTQLIKRLQDSPENQGASVDSLSDYLRRAEESRFANEGQPNLTPELHDEAIVEALAWVRQQRQIADQNEAD